MAHTGHEAGLGQHLLLRLAAQLLDDLDGDGDLSSGFAFWPPVTLEDEETVRVGRDYS